MHFQKLKVKGKLDKMKIMYLLHSTSMGGANISFINMVKGLSKNNIDCYIVYPDDTVNKDFKERISPYIKGLYHVNLKNYFHDSNSNNIISDVKSTQLYQVVKHYREDKELTKLVRRIKPDIIHTNVGVIQAGYRVSQKLGIPHIWHLREYQTKDFSWKIEPSKKKFIKMLKKSYVITITENIRKYFNLDNYSRARVIYNGCFSATDTSLKIPKDKYFLCSSRISPEKGHDIVVKAYSNFYKKHPDYKLLIAGFGEPKYIDKLKKMAKENNCLEGIKFLGFRKDIRELMDNATALIVASRFEGFGRMTAEAAFRGCLVIGNNTGGTKEILQKTGGLAYIDGEKGLEKAMNTVISYSRDTYKKKATKAQNVAVENFSNEQCVEKIYKLYNEILATKKEGQE